MLHSAYTARRGVLAVLATASLGALAGAAPASGAAVALAPAKAAPGTSVTARGVGFARRAFVAITVDGRAQRRVRASAGGTFSARLSVPRGRRRVVQATFSAGRVRVAAPLSVGAAGATASGAEVATSRGARITLPSLRALAGATTPVTVKGAPGRSVRLAIGRGASLTLRGDRLGRASGRLAVPASAGRATLTVRADGTTSRLDFTVTALGLPSPGPTPGPAPEGPAPPGPPPGNPPPPAARLVAVGDIACAPGVPQTPASCHHAEVAALVQSLAPDAIAALGDLQYETGSLIEFQQVFDPTWGTPFGSRLRPVPGNHEYLTPDGAGYFSYFGSAAGDPAQGWYAYDLGSWRVIALNTNDNCSTVACNAGSAQEQFLRDQLVANAGRCTAVYWHHPRFSSGALVGNDTAVNALWTDAYSLGADVVLNGHAHNYERLAKMNEVGTPAAGGLRQFVSGAGGEDLEPFSGPPFNTHSEFRLKAFGALELTLRDGGYDWRFLTEDSVVQDSGTDACRQ